MPVPSTKPTFFTRDLRKRTKTFGQGFGDTTGFRNGHLTNTSLKQRLGLLSRGSHLRRP